MTLQKGRDDIPYSLKPGKFTCTQILYVFSVLRVAGSWTLTVFFSVLNHVSCTHPHEACISWHTHSQTRIILDLSPTTCHCLVLFSAPPVRVHTLPVTYYSWFENILGYRFQCLLRFTVGMECLLAGLFFDRKLERWCVGVPNSISEM